MSRKRLAAARHRLLLRSEQLESRLLMAFDPSPLEQEMLEHLNRMRMNPQAELDVLFSSRPSPLVARDSRVQSAMTYFNVDGNVLQSQWSTLSAAQPLAWNQALYDAAQAHNQLMITYDQQSHQLPGEASLLTRFVNAGFNWSGSVSAGENVYAYADSVIYAHAGFAIDWGVGPGGIQPGAGHRVNMMNANFREVGIAVTAENNAATDVGPLLVTQDFGQRGNFGNSAIVGVVYTDANANSRYDAGEQRGGVQITVTGTGGTFNTTSLTAGGYQIQVPVGTYTVTATGGGLTAPMTVANVVVGSQNVKTDFRATAGGGGGGGTGGTVGGGGTTTPAEDEIAVHRTVWFFRDVNGNRQWDNSVDAVSGFGANGDIPLIGDWDGDGLDQIAVFRRGMFFLDQNANGIWNTGDAAFGFGTANDTPLSGDWNGDGRDEIGVWRSGEFFLDLNGNRTWDAADRRFRFGGTTDRPVVGDWDGDGRDQVATVRNAAWTFDQNGDNTFGTGDVVVGFGLGTDTPLAGDFDGDGRDQIAVWRSGTFFIDQNGTRAWDAGDVSGRFGLSTDRPLVGKWTAPSTAPPPLNASSNSGESLTSNAQSGATSRTLVSSPRFGAALAGIPSGNQGLRERRGLSSESTGANSSLTDLGNSESHLRRYRRTQLLRQLTEPDAESGEVDLSRRTGPLAGLGGAMSHSTEPTSDQWRPAILTEETDEEATSSSEFAQQHADKNAVDEVFAEGQVAAW